MSQVTTGQVLGFRKAPIYCSRVEKCSLKLVFPGLLGPQPLLRNEMLEVHKNSRRPGLCATKVLDIYAPLSLQELRGESEALAQG